MVATSAPVHGSPWPEAVQRAQRGFTLLELLLVVALVAMATAGVSLALRDSSGHQLEREAQRLSALLDGARAQSRMRGVAVVWEAVPRGFVLDGVARDWLAPGTRVDVVSAQTPGNATPSTQRLALGPDPLSPPVRLKLRLGERELWLTTDGARPFVVSSSSDATAGSIAQRTP